MNKNPKIENLKPFKKGKDNRRNIKGRPPKLPKLDEILADVLGEVGPNGIDAATSILKALRAKAAKGDVRAAELLLDRAYGKAKQSHEITGKNENPIIFTFSEIEREDDPGEETNQGF